MKTFTLQPLQEDFRKQVDVADDMLKVIEELNSVSDSVSDKLADDQRQTFTKAVEKLESASERLIGNARQVKQFISDVA